MLCKSRDTNRVSISMVIVSTSSESCTCCGLRWSAVIVWPASSTCIVADVEDKYYRISGFILDSI